jgi:cytochrome oxidase assembly protein ShyY1
VSGELVKMKQGREERSGSCEKEEEAEEGGEEVDVLIANTNTCTCAPVKNKNPFLKYADVWILLGCWFIFLVIIVLLFITPRF